jgi:hypothetical protein
MSIRYERNFCAGLRERGRRDGSDVGCAAPAQLCAAPSQPHAYPLAQPLLTPAQPCLRTPHTPQPVKPGKRGLGRPPPVSAGNTKADSVEPRLWRCVNGRCSERESASPRFSSAHRTDADHPARPVDRHQAWTRTRCPAPTLIALRNSAAAAATPNRAPIALASPAFPRRPGPPAEGARDPRGGGKIGRGTGRW